MYVCDDRLTWLTSTLAAPYSVFLAEKTCSVLQHGLRDFVGLEVGDCLSYRLCVWMFFSACVVDKYIRTCEFRHDQNNGGWEGWKVPEGAEEHGCVCVCVVVHVMALDRPLALAGSSLIGGSP